jgi:hypothetical protein
MFIRRYKNTNKKTGKTYQYFAIVNSERIGNITQQKTILKLGSDFNLPEEKWGMLIKKVQKHLTGQQSLFETSFNKEYDILAKKIADEIIANRIEQQENITKTDNSDIISVSRSGIDGENFRSVGVEHVALCGAQNLKLLEIFKSIGLDDEKAKIGLAAVVARMAHPGSERETFRWLNNDSSLCELLNVNIDYEKLLHRIVEEIYDNKQKIEKKIIDNINHLINATSVAVFYDLTNTYFESNNSAEKAKRGHSKEKRTDCPLITLAVVLDFYGYVIRSEIFPGNASEPKTMEVMLNKLQAIPAGKVIMDRGIATADNIQWLNEHGYSYLVVNREQKRAFNFDQAIPIKTKSGNIVQIYKEFTDDMKEARLFCYSENRSLKESAIWQKKSTEFEEQLKKIDEGLTKKRCQKEKIAIERRIGRLFEKYSGISQHYSVSVEDNSLIKSENEQLIATKIQWSKKPVPGSMMEKPGVYCLRSNDLKMSPQDMWYLYSKLTDIESVFRSLKNELGLRPIYHHKESSIESHLFITVLAYQCVQYIRSTLKASGINQSWWSLRNCLASHGRMTFVLPKEEGSCELIRKTLKPEIGHVAIYRALRITNRPGVIRCTTKPPKPT